MESQRIHSLDAMRAILMLLGVYFHLSLAYVTFGDGSEGWVKDPNSTSPIFDLLFSVNLRKEPVSSFTELGDKLVPNFSLKCFSFLN